METIFRVFLGRKPAAHPPNGEKRRRKEARRGLPTLFRKRSVRLTMSESRIKSGNGLENVESIICHRGFKAEKDQKRPIAMNSQWAS